MRGGKCDCPVLRASASVSQRRYLIIRRHAAIETKMRTNIKLALSVIGARASGPPRRARRMRYISYQNCASCAGVIGTNSFSCKTIRLLPRMSCHHCRAEPSTIAATSTRKKTATSASNRQTPACRTNSAALAAIGHC